MTYRVRLSPQLDAELEEVYQSLIERALDRGPDWYNGLINAIQSLRKHTRRCPLAPEAEQFQSEIRQLIYGQRSGRHRILFRLKDDTVYILHVRHGARRPVDPSETGE